MSTQLIMGGTGNNALATSGTEMMNPNMGRDYPFYLHGAMSGFTFAASGTISNFRGELETAPGGSATRTFRLYKNGVAADPQFTFGSGDTQQSDAVNTVSVSAGDYISIEATSANTPAATGWYTCLVFTPDTADEVVLSVGTDDRNNISATEYIVVNGGKDNNWTGTLGDAEQIIPCDGDFTAIYAELQNSLSSGSYDFDLMVNGVASALGCTVTGQSGSGTATVSVSAGDKVCIRSTPSSPSAAERVGVGLKFEPSTAGEVPYPSGAWINSFNTALTRYNHIGTNGGAYENTNLDSYSLIGENGKTCQNLYMEVDAAPGAGKSVQGWITDSGGTDTAVTATIDGASETEDNSGGTSEELSQNDKIIFKVTPSGSPTSVTALRWSFCLYEAPAGGADEEVLHRPKLVDSLLTGHLVG